MSRRPKTETITDNLSLFQAQNASRLKKIRRELRALEWRMRLSRFRRFMKKIMIALAILLTGLAARAAQVTDGNVGYPGVLCPDDTPTVVVQRTLSPGTWVVHGVANVEFTNANPGHNLGVAFVADVTTRGTIRHDGCSSLPGTVFSSHYGYMTGSPQRVITVSQPTVVKLLVHVIVGSGTAKAWGSIIALRTD